MPSDIDRPIRYLELLQRAVDHIDAHLEESLDADALSRQSAMSVHHFHRLFGAMFGVTVAGYVTWRRLRRACELLEAGQGSTLDIAIAVGYGSSQALAKAMRRELDTTPSDVRGGTAPGWHRLFDRRSPPQPRDGDCPMMNPKMIDLPAFDALTTTARGMHDHHMTAAAKVAFAELFAALDTHGLAPRLRSCLALSPDSPKGADDPGMRFVAAAVFGYSLVDGSGAVERPSIDLDGSLAWWTIPAGRHAVFTHIGPYETLFETWQAIYRHWLPATGYPLRNTAPFELYVNDPTATPPAQLRTDIHIPLA